MTPIAPFLRMKAAAFDARRAYAHVKALSFPRLVGTPGEAKARSYIEARLRRLGLAVERQEFRYTMAAWEFALRLALLAQSGLLVLAAWLLPRAAWAAAAICAFMAVTISLLSRWGYLFEILDRDAGWTSSNVVARPKGRRSAGRPTVVIMAHYDSKAQTIPLLVRYVLFATGFLATLGLSVVIPILALTSARPNLLPWTLASVVPNLFLLFNGTTNASSGAVDNASGVGIFLELARVLTRSPARGRSPAAPRADLMFVATGAEEVGMIGAARFIRAYGPALDPRTTYVINLDGAGAQGDVVIVTGFGIPPVRTCRRLRSLAREILAELGLRYHDSALPIGAGLDSLPIAARGYEAITIASGSLSGSTFGIHSKNDRLAHVDVGSLRRCGELAAGLARRV